MSIYKRSSARRARNSITGGSGDVNPQYMHLTATQSSADAVTTATFNIPIQRLQNAGRAQVMEILKVFWWCYDTVEVDSGVQAHLTTSSSGTTATNYGNTRIIDSIAAFKAITTSGGFQDDLVKIHDLSDGAGHGLLVGTDNIYLQVQSSSTSVANTVYCKLLYRWKDVSMTEYVGIVQSQQ